MATEILPRVARAPGGASAHEADGALHVTRGPLLEALEARRGMDLAAYRAVGGYALPGRISAAGDASPFLAELNRAGVRGRAGGGYPTAHKWYLVARREAPRKFFVCNAHARPQDVKAPYLLSRSPHAVLEAVAAGALLAGADTAYVALPAGRPDLADLLGTALDELRAAGLLGDGAFGGARRLDVVLATLPDAHVAGEETALLEALEGRPPRPRGKPPLPVAQGLFGAPTAVSSLETVLQAWLALSVGAAEYRRAGTAMAPGTMVFTLQGDVTRSGLYELPLGTPLSALLAQGGGPRGGEPVKLVFPGGLSSPPLGADGLDVPLEYDALRDAGSDLGAGTVMVLAGDVSAPALALELAAHFRAGSCGKCRPCADGTARTVTMLERLDVLDTKSVDLPGRIMPQPKRRYALRILGQADPSAPTGVSYTDMTTGLAKVEEFLEFFKYRGDCHHSTEAASVLQRVIALFRPEFEARVAPPQPAVHEGLLEPVGAD